MKFNNSRWFLGAMLVLASAPAPALARDPISELTKGPRVYVPQEEIEVVFERDKQGVILPQARFDALLEQATANLEKNPVPAGVAVVVASADYAARTAGDQLLISVTAELTQFEDNWHETRFGLQRLALEQALLDGAPALIGRNQDGSVSLLTESRGKHKLTLQLSTDLTALGSDQIAAFSLLRAPAGSLTISLPAGKRLLIGSLQLARPAPLDKVADYQIAVGGMGGLQLRITDRATENAADSMTFASTGYGLNVLPGEVTWHALTTLQVFGKPVDRLTFSVPSQLEIAEVESTGLESWELSDDPNEPQRTVISLTFGQPFDGQRKISLKGVMATAADKPWMVPPLRIANVTSHIGQVVVQHASGIRLRVEETEGVRRATVEQKPAADMPDDAAGLNPTQFLRFDVWQPEFTLRFTTQPKQREVQTALAAVLDVNVTGLELQAAITVESHFGPLFELDLHLPVEWQVVSAVRDNNPLSWQIVGLDQPGVNHLRILLNPSIAAETSGQILLSLRRDVDGWPVESEPITVNLPELYLPQSSLNEGAFVVRGDDDLELAAFELSGLDPQPLKADYERLRFQSQDTRYAGKLKMTRRPSRISVQTVTIGRIDPQTIHAFMQSAVEVQGGGVRTLQVALPESAGTSLQFECSGPRIVEQKPLKVLNGEQVWSLQFDQRLRGQALIVTDLELPRGEATEYAISQPRFLDADRQNGFFAIEASGEQRLSMTAGGAEGATLTEVDPLDLPQLFYQPKERIVAVYRAIGPGAELKIAEQKFEKLPIVTAICTRLEIASILGRTGELQHRATFQLKVVGVQGLHVTFPAETTLWATLVNGRPVEVRRNGDVYLIPLTSEGTTAEELMREQLAANPVDGADPAVLQLFYRSGVPPITQYGTLHQEPPGLTVESGQRVALPVEVLEQKWNLYYPSEVQVVDSTGPLEPDHSFDMPGGILGTIISSLRFPSTRQFATYLLFAIVVGAPLFYFVRGSRPDLLLLTQISLVVVIIGIVIVISLPSVQQARNPGRYAGKAEQSEERYDRSPILDPAMPAPTAAPATAVTPKFMDEDLNLNGPVDGIKGRAAVDGLPQAQLEKKRKQFGEVAQNPPAKQPRQRIQGILDDVEIDERSMSGEASPVDQGLLSLQIGFEPPAGSREKSFYYFGADHSHPGIPLTVSYFDRYSKTRMRNVMLALCAVIGWFLRRSDLRNKCRLATLGIIVPLMSLPFVPVYGHGVIDGVFFGTLIAVAIWILCPLICHCLRRCGSAGAWKNVTTQASAGGMVFLLLCADGGRILAEDKAVPNSTKPATRTEAAGTPNPVIVPFASGKEPLASDRVFLSYEQFLELYRLANPEKAPRQPAPQNGGLIEAFYSAKVVANGNSNDESVVEVTARYAVRNLVDGQLIVELPVGQVSARSAKLNGQSAALIPGNTGFSVAIPKSGLHVIDFTFNVPARLSGSTGSFVLPLKPAPAGKLSFEIPGKDLSVRVNGSTTIFRQIAEAKTLELPIDQGGELSITWQPRQAQGATAAVVHVDSVEAVTLTDAGATVSHGFAYRVRQGGISDVSFLLPDSLKLQSVNGPDVGGWELQGEAGERKLRVVFRRNVTELTRLTLETFLDVKVSTQATLISIPQVAPLEVTTEIGQLAVFAGNQFSIRAEETGSLAQVDGDKFFTLLPITRPNVFPELAYRFSKRPISFSVRVTRLESQAHVSAQQAAFITLRKQHLTTRLRYQLTGAPRSALTVSLPPGFVLLDVQATGLRDWYVSRQDENSSLTVELNAPRIGQVEFVVTGFVAGEPSLVPVKFPQPQDITRLDSTAAIWLDEGFSATVASAEGWRSVDATQISGELKSVRHDHPVQFAFSSSNQSVSEISLKVTRATPRLSANGLSMVTVTDISVIYTLALQWKIDAAKTDVLTLTTPNWLAGRLTFQGENLRETVQSDAGNDRTRWTIYLRTPLSGKYFATAIATLPPATTKVAAPALVFENEQQPIETQRQYVLLINSSLSQLTSVDPSLIETVQRDDVPVVIKQEFVDQATELDRVKALLSAPEWSVHRFPQQPGAPASVNVADLTTVISRDGTYRAEAVFTIKNRSRQFLALKMPDETELLSVFVGGLPSRAVLAKLPSLNGATAQLIALPKTSAASLSFPVKIVWRGSLGRTLPHAASFGREEFQIPSPQILSQQQDADFGIPVARTRWTVYLPQDLEAQASRLTAKHNLSLSADTDQLYGKALLQEAEEFIGSASLFFEAESSGLSSMSSSRQKEAYTGAVKHLGFALSDLQYRGADEAQFNKNKADVLRRLTEIENLARLERQKQVSQQSQSIGANGGFLGDELANNWSIPLQQQRMLAETNTSAVSSNNKADDEKFHFGLATVTDGEATKSIQDLDQKMDAKQAKSLGRANLRNANDVNTDKLNEIVSNNATLRNSALGLQSNALSQQITIQGNSSWGDAGAKQRGVNEPEQGMNVFSAQFDPFSGQPLNPGSVSNFQGVPAKQLRNFSEAENPNSILWGSRFANQFQPPTANVSGNLAAGGMGGGGGFSAVPAGGPAGGGAPRFRAPTDRQNNGPAKPALGVGMGGGMGGLGGMGGDAPVNRAEEFAQQQAQDALAEGMEFEGRRAFGAGQPWRQAGGLSLEIQMPKVGQKLVFTKTGGDPRLSLVVGSQKSDQQVIKVLWSLLWLVIGLLLFLALQSVDGMNRLRQQWPVIAMLLGILGFFLLNNSMSSVSFGLFAIGVLAMAVKLRRPEVPA